MSTKRGDVALSPLWSRALSERQIYQERLFFKRAAGINVTRQLHMRKTT